MPHASMPIVHEVSSLQARHVEHNGSQWLEITAFGPAGNPVKQSFFFELSPTTPAYIAGLAAAINAVPLVMLAPAELEAA